MPIFIIRSWISRGVGLKVKRIPVTYEFYQYLNLPTVKLNKHMRDLQVFKMKQKPKID